ncbi:Hypothetical predicted protein [Pelobates cultripes]|uniref:Uncharacterized protein n=1 Tax=Pelobates cultripes TaxID=61616 RepID=A0AAD1T7K5_PELCU|nr:Hypothetical predicted protein [Pelobates cultripes]
MADHYQTTRSDKQRKQPGATHTRKQARDPITLIFDHFWAKIWARLRAEAPCQNPTYYDQSQRQMGPPWPHKRGKAKQRPKRPAKTPRTTPKRSSLDHDGLQARGLQAPALTQPWGRRGSLSPKHRSSTQMRPTSGRQQTTVNHKAHCNSVLIPAHARGEISPAYHTSTDNYQQGPNQQKCPDLSTLHLTALASIKDRHLTRTSRRVSGDTGLANTKDYLLKHNSGIG